MIFGHLQIVDDSSNHRVKPSSTLKESFSLDVSGPLMPHHVHGLVTLLNHTQTDGEYSVACGTRTYTAPFNVNRCENLEGARINRDDSVNANGNDPGRRDVHHNKQKCGLPADCVRWLASDNCSTTLRQVDAKNESYNWSS